MLANSRALHEQLAVIMSTLSKAALTQMCAAVDQGLSALHAEILRKHKENDELKKKLHLIESIVVHAGVNSKDGAAERMLPGAGFDERAEEPLLEGKALQVQEEVGIKHEDPGSGGPLGQDVQCVERRGAPRAENSAPMRTSSPEAGSSSDVHGSGATFKCELFDLDLQVVDQHLSEPLACGQLFSSVTQTPGLKVDLPAAWTSSTVTDCRRTENCDAFGEESDVVTKRGRGQGRGSGPKKRYICPFCHKALVTAQNLESHKRVHTGERPFKCNECGKRFIQSGHLKSHIQSIHGAPAHPCPVCGRGFSSIGTMQAHVEKWHPN